jgi:hypothetical protein
MRRNGAAGGLPARCGGEHDSERNCAKVVRKAWWGPDIGLILPPAITEGYAAGKRE